MNEYQVPYQTKPKEIKQFLTSRSDYDIYVLQCPCKTRYVGSTIHPVKKRVLEHMTAIDQNDPDYPVARHFSTEHFQDRNSLTFFAVERISVQSRGGNGTLIHRRKESKYILDLETKQPGGLNTEEELRVHLGDD